MTTNQIILAVVCAVLIVFSLVVAIVVPKRNPDFPARGLGAFFLVALVLVAGMLTAVEVLGKEKEAAAAQPETTQPQTATQPAETATQPAQTTQPAETTTPAATAPPGDAAAGKAVFEAQGCAACHTFTPAGSSGTVGPKLDNLAADAQAAGEPLADFVKRSIVDPGAYVAPGYPDGVMPTTFGQSISAGDLDNLVAFILSGQPAQ